jgi:hypothetical protein
MQGRRSFYFDVYFLIRGYYNIERSSNRRSVHSGDLFLDSKDAYKIQTEIRM